MRKADATNTFQEGMLMDINPLIMPDNTMTNALNATLMTMNGNENVLQNDMGNARVETAYLPEGYIPLGSTSFGGIIYVASYNPLTNKSQIGSFPSPERNITTSEISQMSDVTISNTDFGWDEEKGAQKYYIKKIVNQDLIFYPGDKFIVYSSGVEANYLKFYKKDEFESFVNSIRSTRATYLSNLALKKENGIDVGFDFSKDLWELINSGAVVQDWFINKESFVNGKVAEKNALKAELNGYNNTLANILKDKSIYDVQISEYDNNIIELNNKIIDTNNRFQYNTDLKAIAEANKTSYANQLNRLNSQFEQVKVEYDSIFSKYNSASAQIKDYENVIAGLEQNIVEAENRLNIEIPEEKKNLLSVLESLKTSQSIWQEAFNTSSSNIDQLKSELADLDHQLEDSNARVESLKDQAAKLETEVKGASERVNGLLASYNTNKSLVEEKILENNTLQEKIDAFEGLTYLTDRNNSLQAVIDDYNQNLEYAPATLSNELANPNISGSLGDLVIDRPGIFDQLQPGRVDYEIGNITNEEQLNQYQTEISSNQTLINQLEQIIGKDYTSESMAENLATIQANKAEIPSLNIKTSASAVELDSAKTLLSSLQTEANIINSQLATEDNLVASIKANKEYTENRYNSEIANKAEYEAKLKDIDAQINGTDNTIGINDQISALDEELKGIPNIISANQEEINEYRDLISGVDFDSLEIEFNTIAKNRTDLEAQIKDTNDWIYSFNSEIESYAKILDEIGIEKSGYESSITDYNNKIAAIRSDETFIGLINSEQEVNSSIVDINSQIQGIDDIIIGKLEEDSLEYDTDILEILKQQTLKLNLGCLTKDGKITKFDNLKQYRVNNITYPSSLNKTPEYHIFQYNVSELPSGQDIDEYRSLTKQPYNIFSSKIAGNIVVIGELIQFSDFDASIENTVVESNGVKHYRPKFYLEMSDENYFLPKGVEFKVTLTGEDVNLEPITFKVDFWEEQTTSSEQLVVALNQEIYKLTTDCKSYSIEIDTSKWGNNPLSTIFDEIDKYLTGSRNKNYIINFELTPYMNWGELPLNSTISVDIDKLGTNEINITQWRYYVQEDKVILNWGIESYMDDISNINDIEFIFRWVYSTTQIYGVKYTIPAKQSYFGIYTENLPFSDDDGFIYTNYNEIGVITQESLYPTTLCLVEIKINYNVNNQSSIKRLNKWLYTIPVFNDYYQDNDILDFSNLKINLDLDINTTVQSNLSREEEESSIPKYFYPNVDYVDSYEKLTVTRVIKKQEVQQIINSNIVFNDYNLFELIDLGARISTDLPQYINLTHTPTFAVTKKVNFSSDIINDGGSSIIKSVDNSQSTEYMFNNPQFGDSGTGTMCYYRLPKSQEEIRSNNVRITATFPFIYEARGYGDGRHMDVGNTLQLEFIPIIQDIFHMNKYHLTISNGQIIPTFVCTFGYGSNEGCRVYMGNSTSINSSALQTDTSQNVIQWGNDVTKSSRNLYITGYRRVGEYMQSNWISHIQNTHSSDLVLMLYKYGYGESDGNSYFEVSNNTVYPANRKNTYPRLLTLGLLGQKLNNTDKTLHNHQFIFLNSGIVASHTNRNGTYGDNFIVSSVVQQFYKQYLSVLCSVYTYTEKGSATNGEGYGLRNLYYYDTYTYNQEFKYTITISKFLQGYNPLRIKLNDTIKSLGEYKALLSSWISDNYDPDILDNNLNSTYSGDTFNISVPYSYSYDMSGYFKSTMINAVTSSVTCLDVEGNPITLNQYPQSRDPNKLYRVDGDGNIVEINSGFTAKLLTFEINNNKLSIKKDTSNSNITCNMNLSKFLQYDPDNQCLKSKDDSLNQGGCLFSRGYFYGYSNGQRLYISGWSEGTDLISNYSYLKAVTAEGKVLTES